MQKDTKKTRVGLVRNVAPCCRPTTNVIGPLHECKKVCTSYMQKSPTTVRQSWINQARSEEEEKERKRDRKDRGQGADGKLPNKTKPIRGTKTMST